MLATLMILGLIGMGVGTTLSAIGTAQQTREDIRVAELQARQEQEAQGLYLRQQQTTQAQIRAVESQAVIQGTQIAYSGRQATGSVAARAGVGNVGGASVARQAQAIKKQVGWQQAGLQIQTKQTVLGLETEAFGQGLNAKWAGERSEELTAEADWLRRNGWMRTAGVVAQGVGNMAMSAAGFNWGASSNWSWPGAKPAQTQVTTPPVTPYRDW